MWWRNSHLSLKDSFLLMLLCNKRVYKEYIFDSLKNISIVGQKYAYLLNWFLAYIGKGHVLHFFVFCRKIVFKLVIWPNDVSEWKKHLKIDVETRSCDFLTKTHEKNPMSRNIRILATTLENGLTSNIVTISSHSRSHTLIPYLTSNYLK